MTPIVSSQRVLRSALLETHRFKHGFSLRQGGVSVPPFDTLNLGRQVSDNPKHVVENHRRFAAEVGYDAEGLYEISQVHGCHIEVADPTRSAASFRVREGDALIGSHDGVAVAVRTADCMPLLLADPESGVVAAVHAGWRGIALGVVRSSVLALTQRMHVKQTELLVGIGPHIRQCCFEVGEDVRAILVACSDASNVVITHTTKPRVSLVGIVMSQLLSLGALFTHIDDVGGCTHCEGDRFFSYRRDGAASGRHAAVIVSR
ncbi:MAG: peptidoglycan editing factor PgeF [Myxococcales bacterium]|nr:peptidoglycan editing factor PgeF [Myxococcales bacterium]